MSNKTYEYWSKYYEDEKQEELETDMTHEELVALGVDTRQDRWEQ